MKWLKPFSFGLLTLIALGVVIDQVSKNWSERHFLVRSDSIDTRVYQGSREVVLALGDSLAGVDGQTSPSWLLVQWNYVRNHGAAYGTFANLSDSVRLPLFHLLTAVFCAFFLGIALTNRVKIPQMARFAIGFLISGALGNLVDRMTKGFVVDLIDVRWQVLGWRSSLPVFNVADVFVIVGIFLLIISSLRR